MSLPLLLAFALCTAIGQMAAVAEWRLFGLLAAAERDGEILGDSIAQWPQRCATMRAVAVRLPLAAAAGTPHHQVTGRKLCPERPIGRHCRRSGWRYWARGYWVWPDRRRCPRGHSRKCRAPSAGSA